MTSDVTRDAPVQTEGVDPGQNDYSNFSTTQPKVHHSGSQADTSVGEGNTVKKYNMLNHINTTDAGDESADDIDASGCTFEEQKHDFVSFRLHQIAQELAARLYLTSSATSARLREMLQTTTGNRGAAPPRIGTFLGVSLN